MTPSERVHDGLRDHLSLELQPGICETIAAELFEGYVPATQADERYQESVKPIIDVLQSVQDLLRACRAWQGPEEWRDEQVSHIDDLISNLS